MLNATSCLLGIIAAILCLLAGRRLRDTTLAAPSVWAAASLAVATANLLYGCVSPSASWVAHLEYLAGTTTVAPFVALLGAKRPQDRAWQWIVVALVGLLAFQDLRSWSIDPTASPALHAAWQWLLAGLIVVQLLNYLPTRHAATACLACLGQACILAGNLPFVAVRTSWSFPLGLALLSLAVLVATVLQRWLPRSATGWKAAWLDFRDMYGALWGLRVAERVNSLAVEQHCAVRLTWHGFGRAELAETSTGKARLQETESLQRAMRSVLTRFVSANWLARRLGESS